MRAERDYSDYLHDIIEYAQKAMNFLEGIDLDGFKLNDEKSLAVIRALEVIGEAARHIPKSARKKYPKVPWEDMTGIRDKLIHDYVGVDMEVIWRTVKEDLPAMKDAVQEILPDFEQK